MSIAELGFLGPLFDLAGSLADSNDVEDMSMGLGEIAPDSMLRGDDRDLDGMWVSMVVNNSILSSLDHVITLRDLVTRDQGTITVGAPWTLLRAAVESSALALWVMHPDLRKTRRARALRVWHHDYSERQKWESDTGRMPTGTAKSGKTRAVAVLALAESLGIKGTQVATPVAYSDAVAAAGEVVGWTRAEARARWREASAFAHGRSWPMLALTSPRDAQLIDGGVGMHLTLDEQRLESLARLAHDLLHACLLRYSDLAAASPTN